MEKGRPMIDYNAIAKTGGIPRVSSRGGVDMSGLPFGKTNRRQRENKRARKEARRAWCEIPGCGRRAQAGPHQDRKSTRLNSSHVRISYAVFCLKKKSRPRPT